MAHSRLERVGTIFSRITSLIQGGSMKEQNVPLWYEIYKAFPPKYEPRHDRPASDKPIKDIFYEEDILRVKFHKDVEFLPKVDLKSKKNSHCETFLQMYAMYKKDGLQETDAYEKAMAAYRSMFPSESAQSNKSTPSTSSTTTTTNT